MIDNPHKMSVPKIPKGGRKRPSWMPGGQDEKIDDGSRKVNYQPQVTDTQRREIREQHISWLRFIALCALGGITAGFVAAGLIVRFDFNGIGQMITNSPDRFLYSILLAGSLGSTGGMIAMGIGIMIRASMEE